MDTVFTLRCGPESVVRIDYGPHLPMGPLLFYNVRIREPPNPDLTAVRNVSIKTNHKVYNPPALRYKKDRNK